VPASANVQRERIVAAALELLAEGGIGRLTTRTIGERVGLHNSSLFHHFGSKREIVGTVLARINEGLAQRLAPLAAEREPALDTLLAVLLQLSDHLAANRAEARCTLRLLLDPDGLDDEHGGRFTTILLSWLARAQASAAIRPVNVTQAARNLLGILLVDPVWSSRTPRGPRDDERRRSELVAFVRGALAPSRQL
jgi:AcrR family transcriptional regulator